MVSKMIFLKINQSYIQFPVKIYNFSIKYEMAKYRTFIYVIILKKDKAFCKKFYFCILMDKINLPEQVVNVTY